MYWYWAEDLGLRKHFCVAREIDTLIWLKKFEARAAWDLSSIDPRPQEI